MLKIEGDLCYEGTCDVVQAVAEHLSRQPREIALDLSDVGVMDSSGLRSLLQARKLCEEAGTRLRIRAASQCVTRAIVMSGLAPTFLMPDCILAMRPTSSPPEDASEPAAAALSSEFAHTQWTIREYVATSDPYVISVLRDKSVAAALEAGASGETLCDVQIAVGEALTNAFKHGSPRKGIDKITLRCFWCRGAVAFEIEDEGEEFDPDAIPEPDPRKMREHGMGIYLMRQAMDEVEFSRNCSGNRVRMLKWLDREA